MVALDTIVRVLLGVVEYGEKQLLDHMLQGQSPVGDDFVRLTMGGHPGVMNLRAGRDVTSG